MSDTPSKTGQNGPFVAIAQESSDDYKGRQGLEFVFFKAGL